MHIIHDEDQAAASFPGGHVRLRTRLWYAVSDLGCWLYWLWEDRRPGAQLRRRLRAAEQQAAAYEAALKALAESYSRPAEDAS
jgi:hypothetical protein